jgi:acid phosphatase (class A)
MLRFIHHAALAATVLVGSSVLDRAGADPAFLSPAQTDPAKLLPPPPADRSEVQSAELAELHRIEQTRTPARLAQAEADSKNETVTLFAGVLGPTFDIAKLPATAKLFNDIDAEESSVTGAAKKYFHRNRPYVFDPSLKDCGHSPLGGQTSYPSGHTTVGFAMGVVLASLVPSKAQAILARSADFGFSRMVCGVHYRSDVVAGQVLGTVIAEDLLENAAFEKEYAAAKTELEAAHIAP